MANESYFVIKWLTGTKVLLVDKVYNTKIY